MSYDWWYIVCIYIFWKFLKFFVFFYRYDVNCFVCSFRDIFIFCGIWFIWRFIIFFKMIGYCFNVGNLVWFVVVFVWFFIWCVRWGNNVSFGIFFVVFFNDILGVGYVFLFNGVFSVVNNEIGIFIVSWRLCCCCWILCNFVCIKCCIFFLICIMRVSFRFSWNICYFVMNR